MCVSVCLCLIERAKRRHHRVPFSGLNNLAMLRNVGMQDKRPELPEVTAECPLELIQLMQACWARDPVARPRFEMVLDALDGIRAKYVVGAVDVSAVVAGVGGIAVSGGSAKGVSSLVQCQICYDRAKVIMFEPCHHLVSCEECAGVLRECPMCRGAITRKIKVFM